MIHIFPLKQLEKVVASSKALLEKKKENIMTL